MKTSSTVSSGKILTHPLYLLRIILYQLEGKILKTAILQCKWPIFKKVI